MSDGIDLLNHLCVRSIMIFLNDYGLVDRATNDLRSLRVVRPVDAYDHFGRCIELPQTKTELWLV